jgi:predicted nucleic acid-binding protein
MIAVTNASPLIGFLKGECLDVLAQAFDEVYVPPAVQDEVQRGAGTMEAEAFERALNTFLRVREPQPEFLVRIIGPLGGGERAAVALALEPGADYLLADDGHARAEANRHGLAWLMTPDAVGVMKEQGLIPAARPVPDRMQARGFGIRRTIYRAVLRRLGE